GSGREPLVPAPIDPEAGGTFALRGRLVTMDGARTVVGDGVVYVRDGGIVAVQPAGVAGPEGFPSAPISTSGTIYPGLIELHNHLSYNVLQLWQVPKL